MMMKVLLLLFATLIVVSEEKAEKLSRQKRYIFINPTSPITLGFILNMPIALALPTLIVDGRSLDVINRIDMTGDVPEDLYYDPNYEESLGRLALYFNYMAIPSVSCHERIICELGANPEDYSPVTDLIMKEIHQKHGSVDKSNDSLMWRYLKAARTGYISTLDTCAQDYPRCPEPAYKLLNMPVIKVWQFISRTIGLKLI